MAPLAEGITKAPVLFDLVKGNVAGRKAGEESKGCGKTAVSSSGDSLTKILEVKSWPRKLAEWGR